MISSSWLWLFFFGGDEILASYKGIRISHYKDPVINQHMVMAQNSKKRDYILTGVMKWDDIWGDQRGGKCCW